MFSILNLLFGFSKYEATTAVIMATNLPSISSFSLIEVILDAGGVTLTSLDIFFSSLIPIIFFKDTIIKANPIN
jgi:hypothetical protein